MDFPYRGPTYIPTKSPDHLISAVLPFKKHCKSGFSMTKKNRVPV